MLTMRDAILVVLVMSVVLVFFPDAPFAEELPGVRIGILADGPWERNEEVLGWFEKEILELTEGEFDVRFDFVLADWTISDTRSKIDELLRDPNIDIVIALGTLASHEICQLGDLPKPVIAPVIIDAELQKLPRKGGTSGVKNLNYLSFPNNVVRDIKTFLEIVPFKKLVMIVNARVHEAIPDIEPRTVRLLEQLDIQPTILGVRQSIDEALTQLPDDAEAVYVAPMLHLPPGELEVLAQRLIERKLPSFSLFGKSEVERGLLASINAENLPRLARRVALNVQRILLGEDAGTIPVAFAGGEELTINMATARAIGVFPSWSIITEATLLNERVREIERTVSLESAVSEALLVNLDLAAREENVRATDQEIALSRADLLPQIDLSALAVQIDKDRAKQSAGQQSERALTGSITLSQILYSDPAWANYSIQKHLQKTREYDRDVLKLDIAQDAATAYLNVLRAKTFERIQKDNLALTRSNLELAEVREAIGTARLAEVLRWESEIANNRKTVIEANAQRNLTEIQLNRLLNRPAEERFETAEADLDDPNLLLSQGRLLEYMDNPWEFRILRAFMVQEGIANTPEIKALSEAIQAEERSLTAANRVFYLPSFVLQAGVDYVFWRDGAGSDFPDVPPPLSSVFLPPEDLSWDIGVSLVYPLFNGGARYAQRRRSLHALSDLRLELGSLSQKVEQRIRAAFHLTGAAYAGIEQARQSEAAASRTRELVEDAYSRGSTTILDLIDAQNNALVASESAATSVYDFLIDLMEAERSIGRLVLQMSDTEREEFFARMDRFFTEARGEGE